MNYINTVINSVSFVLSPLWKGCRKAPDQTTEVALSALSCGGVSSRSASPVQTIPDIPQMPKWDEKWGKENGSVKFSYNGVNYFKRYSTKGDGACALHALLGKLIESERERKLPEQEGKPPEQEKEILYSFEKEIQGEPDPGSKAREAYVARLEELCLTKKKMPSQLQNLLSRFLIDYLRNGERAGKESKFVFTEVSSKSLSELQNTLLFCHAEQPVLEDLSREFCGQEEVMGAYVKACRNKEYYFSDEEISLMAEVFRKQITLFVEGLPVPMSFNPNGQEKISILLSRNHYSRLETDTLLGQV